MMKYIGIIICLFTSVMENEQFCLSFSFYDVSNIIVIEMSNCSCQLKYLLRQTTFDFADDMTYSRKNGEML